ncbi:MAG TPA: helix-turn-helix domain-containing protein [Kofleriaceae bacterium]|jgi:hypothetical protein
MSDSEDGDGGGELAGQRAFFRQLLELGDHADLGPLVHQALALIVEVSRARTGYLELYDAEQQPQFWKAHGAFDYNPAEIRAAVPRELIGQALGEGRTIETDDMVCAPVGSPRPIGILCLQGLPPRDGSANEAPRTFADATRMFQRRYLLDALKRNAWQVAGTSRELDISRTHLHKLINDYDLRRDGDVDDGEGSTPSGDE